MNLVSNTNKKECELCKIIQALNSKKQRGNVPKEERKRLEKIIDNNKQSINEFQGIKYENKNFKHKYIILLRRSLSDVLTHQIEDANIRDWIENFNFPDSLKNWKYEGWRENRKDKNGQPKHKETKFFLYYSLKINGEFYYANVKMHKDYGEVLYTIESIKPWDLIEGEPPE
ncbi:MAG: hypothetical protein MJ211_00470 [Bacteroidales bacterium]|nr:hypothetical protein [Bacteroidales bacterium]